MTSISSKDKKTRIDIITIVLALGIIGWLITDFFGGMILFLFSYGLLIIPFILLYLILLIKYFKTLIRKRKYVSKVQTYSHGIVIAAIVIFNVYHSDLFKSKRILTATLKDDLYHYTLVFRENGQVENLINGAFGYSETYKGEYHFNGELIIFDSKPYDNNFIPDTLLLDKKTGVIFKERLQNGKFNTEKQWLNHFELK